MKKTYIRLFENCILVNGIKNNLILDLQFHFYYNISKELFDFLNLCQKDPLDQVLSNYPLEERKLLYNVIDSLKNNNLIHEINNPKDFPRIKREYRTPSIFDNCIIEFSDYVENYLENIVSELNLCSVKFVEIRFYNNTKLSQIENLLENFENSKVRGI